jgi:hypothetical protein
VTIARTCHAKVVCEREEVSTRRGELMWLLEYADRIDPLGD